jgi:hypothetical protein
MAPSNHRRDGRTEITADGFELLESRSRLKRIVPDMPEWEYRVVGVDVGRLIAGRSMREELESTLAEFGDHGWELVACIETHWLLIFKRPRSRWEPPDRVP